MTGDPVHDDGHIGNIYYYFGNKACGIESDGEIISMGVRNIIDVSSVSFVSQVDARFECRSKKHYYY